jgi:hypothetical protein
VTQRWISFVGWLLAPRSSRLGYEQPESGSNYEVTAQALRGTPVRRQRSSSAIGSELRITVSVVSFIFVEVVDMNFENKPIV